ncbi:type I restriction-modification system subunit M [Bifidobacterium tissieri]|uniref:site-specific DNA-methyltransferase (adenine-specific) n=1 Tax=Bifidobacterium tissieri TaxID=1630162 RepID=A0A5M9ZSP1_9BIFI|nr:class I SAM-dependent DNA methyltransferase [Bifidobacterium tissieri]KAA8829866.1 SAM-dependent DNA methyltransferase [Bifidobacterium tissieri]KAA8830505.1 SAM-dependent DNA methyltransferase [Bifidobacterium tissieri]
MAKKASTKALGFEEQIWDAACKLRGNIDASEYKNVVLGLIFLKYISDNFKAKYAELVAEGEGFEEDRDEYTSENIFWVPKEARWENVAAAAHTPEVGKVIDESMRLIEQENKRLKGVLPKNFARPELDKRRLGEVVDLFTNVKMAENGDTHDLLGRTYEYCLSQFASQEGKNAGEFYTPKCVVKTLVNVLEPFRGRVYDPACGSGGMFVQSAEFVRNHQGNINNISVYGQESNPTTWKMATMNLAIRGIDADLGPKNDDTFFNDLHRTERFDYILANPPFNLSDWGGDKLKDDPRWEYGVPPEGNANFAWMQHMIHHLSQSGRIGLVLANGSLSSQTNNEGEIRKNIVNAGLVEGIVAMPTQLFFSTQIPVCLWFLRKGRATDSKTLFVDARNMGTMISRSQRTLTDNDIKKIAGTFDAFRDGTFEEEKGFCAAASMEEIAEQDYILTPGRYVGIAEQEEDDEPFDEKMKRLTSELTKCFEESNRLQAEIKKNLEAIGYEM